MTKDLESQTAAYSDAKSTLRRTAAFGSQIDLGTMDETVQEIDARIQARRFTQHGVVNVAKLVLMQRDAELCTSIKACDIVNVDGMGVVWGLRWLGHRVPERVAGIDLFWRLLELSAERGYPVFLLGAEPEVLARCRANVLRLIPALRIAGSHHGYFWENESQVVQAIQESGARLLFVAISSPRKENFIFRWREHLGVDFVMGVGGTFDVVAGKVSRAPKWMQKSGMEWLYRLLQEPRRMWRRYLTTNVAFVGLVLRHSRLRDSDPYRDLGKRDV